MTNPLTAEDASDLLRDYACDVELMEALGAQLAAIASGEHIVVPKLRKPVAWRYWKGKFNCYDFAEQLEAIRVEDRCTADPLFLSADPGRDALRAFIGAAIPVSTEIDPRGHTWCEAYLDQALEAAKAVNSTESGQPDTVPIETYNQALRDLISEKRMNVEIERVTEAEAREAFEVWWKSHDGTYVDVWLAALKWAGKIKGE